MQTGNIEEVKVLDEALIQEAMETGVGSDRREMDETLGTRFTEVVQERIKPFSPWPCDSKRNSRYTEECSPPLETGIRPVATTMWRRDPEFSKEFDGSKSYWAQKDP